MLADAVAFQADGICVHYLILPMPHSVCRMAIRLVLHIGTVCRGEILLSNGHLEVAAGRSVMHVSK
jgi:hypothetical protein